MMIPDYNKYINEPEHDVCGIHLDNNEKYEYAKKSVQRILESHDYTVDDNTLYKMLQILVQGVAKADEERMKILHQQRFNIVDDHFTCLA